MNEHSLDPRTTAVASAAVEKLSELEGKVQRASELTDMTCNEADRLSHILVSLRGNVPQDATEKGTDAGPASLLQRLNLAQTDQRAAIDEISTMLGELESLI